MGDVFLFILAAWLLADFLSGLGHWIEDRYLTPDMPFVGQYISLPNEIHHERPTLFIEGTSYWQRNWTTFAVVGPLFAITLGFNVLTNIDCGFLLLTFAFLSQAAEIHALAHMGKEQLSQPIQVMQEMGILQSKRQHSIHHIPNHTTHFCAMSNFLNPLLESIGLWESFEYLLTRAGINPKEPR